MDSKTPVQPKPIRGNFLGAANVFFKGPDSSEQNPPYSN